MARTVLCWWCVEPLDPATAAACPLTRHPPSRAGYFCGPPCVKAFAVREAVLDPRFGDAPRLTDLEAAEAGLPFPVRPAPCPLRAQRFGGEAADALCRAATVGLRPSYVRRGLGPPEGPLARRAWVYEDEEEDEKRE